MTATAEPLARVEAPPSAALDRAAGIELLGHVHGSGYRDGAALVRRADGQMVQLGPLLYALLDCVDGRRETGELASCLSDRLGRRFEEKHVLALAEKLACQGLLAGTEDAAPPKANPLLALRWKLLVTNPAVTDLLTRPFTLLFRRWLVWPILAAFAGVFWFVLVHKGIAGATSQAFQNPELLLLVFGLAVASAGFHELGHAAACRYGGASPGGMGCGLYLVWPAFYTDVTDAYRLPRGDRLRVDLGGLYFNAIISVATLGAWLVWHVDALLLLVALQLLQMVQQLSPMIRADGYHILSDLTGVPDLYAHIGPTLRRLLPWRRPERSALTGRARLIVTLWVLVVVPVLLCLALGAILLLPRLVATAWESGSQIASAVPEQLEDADALGVLTSLLRLFALVLPVVGTVLIAQRILRTTFVKARDWSDGRPGRRLALALATVAAAAVAAWAWWPSGQYEPIRATDRGTLARFGTVVASPRAAARPAVPAPLQLEPGTHLAVSMIPVGGATEEHPALLVIPGEDDEPAVAIVTATAPDAEEALADTPPAAEKTSTTPAAEPAPAAEAPAPSPAVAFPFELPAAPKPGDTQAVAVNTKDGAVAYTVAYALVTVSDNKPVTNTNSAFAFASCKACTTVAVSFQVVLIIGRSNVIAPINAAGALNYQCPACVTTAIADQLVVTLTAQPSDELTARLTAALEELDALPTLGTNPTAVVATVVAVHERVKEELEQSGLLANPPPTTTTATTPTATTSTTPTATTTTATATTGTATTATETSTTETTPTETSTTPTTTTTTGVEPPPIEDPSTTTTTPTGTTETTP